MGSIYGVGILGQKKSQRGPSVCNYVTAVVCQNDSIPRLFTARVVFARSDPLVRMFGRSAEKDVQRSRTWSS